MNPYRQKILRGVTAVALIFILVAGTVVAAQGDAAPGGTLWGVVVPQVTPETESALAELGVAWTRVTFDWRAFQPASEDAWESPAVDPVWVEAEGEAGREVVGMIVGTPAWASDTGAPNGVPRGLTLDPGDADNAWAAFVTRLAEMYEPLGVHRWIISDTPDVRPGEGHVQFAGDVDHYARLLAVARVALVSVDPQAEVIVAAMDGWVDVAAGREPYLGRLLRTLETEPSEPVFDAVVVRATTGTQAIWERVQAARAALDKAGRMDAEIWLEAGVSPDPAALLGVTPEQQSDLIVQAAASSAALGVARFAAVWLADDDAAQTWGLIAADGARRPALDAYSTVIDLLAGAQPVTHKEHPAMGLIELGAGGQTVFVAWARGEGPVELRITSPVVGEQADLINPREGRGILESGSAEWPAAFVLELPPATRDQYGFLTVAGSPRGIVVDGADDFYRVVWIVVNGQYVRLR